MVILTVISAADPKLNVFMLFLFITILLFFMSVKNIYKHMIVRILGSASLLNLIFLSAGMLYKWESTSAKMILLEVSIGIAFAEFCVTVLWSLIKPFSSAVWKCRQRQSYDVFNQDVDDVITHERIEDPELEPLITGTKTKYYYTSKATGTY